MVGRGKLGRYGRQTLSPWRGFFQFVRRPAAWLPGLIVFAVITAVCVWAVSWWAGWRAKEGANADPASEQPTSPAGTAADPTAMPSPPESALAEPVAVPPESSALSPKPPVLPPDPSTLPAEPSASSPEPKPLGSGPSSPPREPIPLPPGTTAPPEEPIGQHPEPGHSQSVPEHPRSEPESLSSGPPTAASEVAGSTAERETAAREQIKGLREEAAEVAAGLLHDFPDNAEALIIVGNMHVALGNSAAALQSWKKSLELDPKRADVYQGMGEVALKKGEFDEALALWRKAEQIDPKMAGIHCSLARALMNLRRPQEAIAELENETEISPGSGLSYYLLGQAYLQVEEYEKARRNYEQAVAVQPDLWNAYYGLATAYARLGQADKSQECREKFKKLKAEELKVTLDRSVAYDDLQVVRRDVVLFYLEVGRLYQQGKNPTAAERHWLRAAALDAKNARCREYLAELYQSSGREAEALEMYRLLREIDPKNPLYCASLGVVHTRLKRFEEAEQAFVEAQQLAPQQSLGYRALAQLYLHTNQKLAEARALARKAVELEPLALNYSVLSEAYDKSGDRPGALDALRQAMQLDPDNQRYRRIYEQLQRE